MSQDAVSIDNRHALRRVLDHAEALLLDFDGPVCSVFAGYPAPDVADQLREVLAEVGHEELPEELRKTADPFDIFAYAALLGADEARYVESALRAHEVEAIETSEPTSGAHELIRHWSLSGRRLAIVSNNSMAAIESYLHLHGLRPSVATLSARASSDPTDLKPSPHLIDRALSSLDIDPSQGVFVGDSPSDMIAGRAANVVSVGYANKPGKAKLLSAAGAHAIATSMSFFL
ncbi:HAD family hydrolase [Lentzea sp. JNUCC 0626]|uniref:HAD family hydrolase n=1 Tax=Lentzea sp. JNUCC 0626 TaxID=3367513 RepID=UPI003747E511